MKVKCLKTFIDGQTGTVLEKNKTYDLTEARMKEINDFASSQGDKKPWLESVKKTAKNCKTCNE